MAAGKRPPVRGSQRERVHRRATPAELDAAAHITAADVAHADAAWQRHAPGALRRILRATPVESAGPTTPRGRPSRQ